MAETVVLSIRVPAKTKAKLEKLAELSGHSKSWWAAAAIDAYVDHQTPIVKGILKAREQGRAGKTSSMEEVFARLEKRIEARAAKAKRA